MRFIKKRLVMDAYQWTPDLTYKTPNYYWDKNKRGWWIVIGGEKKRITPGDWIVTGITGEQAVVKQDDFDSLC